MTLAVGYGHPVAHLMERGTASRVTKAGRETCVGPARPFLLPALVATVHRLGPAVGEQIRRRGLSARP
jgi:hypothetical protein